jgi:hypothetical protein
MITKEEANELIKGFNHSCRVIESLPSESFLPGDKVIWSDTIGVVVSFEYPVVTVLFDLALNPVRLHCRVCNIERVAE